MSKEYRIMKFVGKIESTTPKKYFVLSTVNQLSTFYHLFHTLCSRQVILLHWTVKRTLERQFERGFPTTGQFTICFQWENLKSFWDNILILKMWEKNFIFKDYKLTVKENRPKIVLTWPRSGIDSRYDFRYGLVCKNRCMFTSDASMLPLADAVIVKKNLHTSEVRFPNISELVRYLTLWSNFQVVGLSFNRVPDLRTMSTCRGTILRLGILPPPTIFSGISKGPRSSYLTLEAHSKCDLQY